MKTSIQKLRKYFRLEAKRGYDNEAVMGGIDNILPSWEGEARADNLPESVIQAVATRLRDYHRLSKESRQVVLQGLWKRIKRDPAIAAELKGEADAYKTPPTPDMSPQQEAKRTVPPVKSATTPPLEKKPLVESVSVSTPQKALPAPPAPHPTIDLQASVAQLKGIGPKRAEDLKRLGIITLRDLLYNFPRRHDDYSSLKPIKDLRYGENVTVIGTVKSVTVRSVRSGKMKLAEAIISDKSGVLRVTWFNQPWIAKQLQQARQIVLAGKTEQYLGRLTMNNPEWEPLDTKFLHTNRIVPVYSLTKEVGQRWMRSTMHKAVKKLAPQVIDSLPAEMLRQAGLLSLSMALQHIHFPESLETLNAAKHRLAFDEIFTLQLGVLRQKHFWQGKTGRIFKSPNYWLAAQLSRLPFALTDAQRNALSSIRNDLISGHPMNRLLQGDVGSGKTVVAAMAMLAIAHHGSQVAFMAPTSILAEQHYESMRHVLLGPGSGLSKKDIGLLVGATPEAEKQTIKAKLAKGEIKIVIGTHALLEDSVIFKDLQLIVIDEQHRFGVKQRGTLRQKGDNPHLLVMTATPIPRSLALTIYGDLNASVIDEMPPGRQPVETYILYPSERERGYRLVHSELEKGHQAFIIYPLVEESDSIEEKAAVDEHDRLQKEIFPQYKLGLLHGRMSGNEKDAVMTKFRNGETQLLVSTSVVEVGVDVPNATVMIIEGAQRFGLAQLHQLRGRIGRGALKSYCLLIPGNTDAVENERLKAMIETNDGFKLAERDLKQRGPGQFLGARQSGYSELQLASITDIRLVEKARKYAQEIFAKDPELSRPEHAALANRIKNIWHEKDSKDIS